MGNWVDQQMAQSQRGPEIETEAAWQVYYIKWAEIFGIPGPCESFHGCQQIVAIYIMYVQCGIKTNRHFVWQQYEAMPRWLTWFSNAKKMLFDRPEHHDSGPHQQLIKKGKHCKAMESTQ
jgi:hypothetical protein